MPLDGTALPETGAAAAREAIDPHGLAFLARELTGSKPLALAMEVWESALCAQVDPEVFFPDLGQPTRTAQAICAACPVRVQCLTVFGDLVQHGVVGGLTVRERRARRLATANREAAA